MDEIHGIVGSKLENMTVKSGYTGKNAQLWRNLHPQKAKMPAPKKEQARKVRYLMLRERSIHLVESRKMT